MDYETLRQRVSGLPSASVPEERFVEWVDQRHILGISRDYEGCLEIFLAGPELVCEIPAVASNVAYDSWTTQGDASIWANRIRLTAEPHFDAVAAFLCANLIENGVLENLQTGFSGSEPVVAMALDRSRLLGESLIGLIGELLIMRTLIENYPRSARQIVGSWFGYGRTSRDFQFGPLGLEVKTTRGTQSTHQVQGLHQIEVGHAVGGGIETKLLLVSVGIEEVGPQDSEINSFSLPSLVARILSLLDASIHPGVELTEMQSSLLARIQEYGAGTGSGYDHSRMQHQVLFGAKWRSAFARAYDMSDPAIAVLRSSDLIDFSMVLTGSLAFTVCLPRQVRGDINPIVGFRQIAAVVMDRDRRNTGAQK